MTSKEMKNEIHDYIANLIINSTISDWENDIFIKNNIKIVTSNNGFNARIYTDNTFTVENSILYFYPLLFLIYLFSGKKEKKLSRLIKAKNKEIESYIDNKHLYNRTLETYKLLPIKELRKKKLQTIKTENENE